MKKLICMLLALWLPLFFSAASFASSSMQLGNAMNTMALTEQANSNDMPEHCQMDMGKADQQADHSKCEHCGLCLSIVYYCLSLPIPEISDLHSLSARLAWASSPHPTTPNHRPPIRL